jgi:AraC family L-rhamnose operon transcriptional activator RhaR
MMRRFRSLLIDRVSVRIPGLHILKFAMHRHLPELASVNPHRHGWSQAILYLSGNGRQRFAGGEAGVEPGTLVLLPPGVPHSFVRSGRRAPLCLLIDFRFKLPRAKAVVCCVNRSELAQIRQNLASLLKHQIRGEHPLHWESSVLVLQLLMVLLRSAGWIDRVPLGKTKQGAVIVQRLVNLELHSPLSEFIRKSGYQRDYLNRLVKKEVGLTLGQYRTQQRLLLAKRLLTQGVRVAEVSTAVGLLDQSYFARWFRKQTGQPPLVWNRRHIE